MKKTLLAKAIALKKVPRHTFARAITPEHQDLAFAFLRGDVSLTQVSGALTGDTKNIHGAYIMITHALKQAHLDGRLSFTNTTTP